MPFSPAPGKCRLKYQEFKVIQGYIVKKEVGRGRQSGTSREDDIGIQYSSVHICEGHRVRWVGKQCSVVVLRIVQGSQLDVSEPRGPAMKQ